MRPARLLLPVVLTTLVACATTPPTSPPPAAAAASSAAPSRNCGPEPLPVAGSLHAVAWMQHAVEYRALTSAMYRNALPALQRGVADRTWTAEVKQTTGFGSLPPAVVMDLDETVLDNSPVQARLVRANGCSGDYRAAWAQWFTEADAGGVPGAVRYILQARRVRDADGRAVRVFFVTNRECEPHAGNADPCPQKAETLENLRRLGLDVPTLAEDTMLRGERPEWAGDKQSRRDAITRQFRIVQLAGDDMGDFLEGMRNAPEAARAAARCRYADWWGERWIILPNPMYGSWQVALQKGSSSPIETQRPLAADDCPQP